MLNASDVKVLDLIAELDCLMAMSSASQEYGYTSPKLTHHRRITVTQGRWAVALQGTQLFLNMGGTHAVIQCVQI